MADLTPEAVAALEGVTPGPERPAYLIRKHGGYYKPNCQGYTGSVILAGRYTLAQAVAYSHPNGPDGPRDGMSYIHEDDVTEPDWLAYRALAADLAAQKARADAALRSVLSDRDALLRLASAYDGEDASQMGEPNPHQMDRDAADWAQFVDARLACARAAIAALIGPAIAQEATHD